MAIVADIVNDKRLESTVRTIQHRITEKRNADIIIKIRNGEIVELTNTDIIRFK